MCDQTSHHQRGAGPDVRRAYGRALEPIDAADHRVMAVGANVRAEALQRRVSYAIQGLVASAVLIFVIVLLAWRLVRSITQPLNEAVVALDAIAAGDLTSDLQSTRKDEIGRAHV